MDSGNGLMSAIIAVLACGMLDICCRTIQQVASTRSTTGSSATGTWRLQTRRHRWTPPANRTIQWTTRSRSPKRRRRTASQGQAHRERPVPPRRCQRTVGPSEPRGAGRRLRPELPHRGPPRRHRHDGQHAYIANLDPQHPAQPAPVWSSPGIRAL
jgi:hypothetical protein